MQHIVRFVGEDGADEKKRCDVFFWIEYLVQGTECADGRWLSEWRHQWSRNSLKKIMVFINPVGGRRKAPQIWNDFVCKVGRLHTLGSAYAVSQQCPYLLVWLVVDVSPSGDRNRSGRDYSPGSVGTTLPFSHTLMCHTHDMIEDSSHPFLLL